MTENPDAKRYKVLLAEDNLTNQKLFMRLLEKLGCYCMLAENGAIAVSLHHQHVFDVILMDIQMPEMSVLEATRHIREGNIRPDIPIIALTANAFAEDRAAALACGMNDFLSKPLRPDALHGALARYHPQ